MGPGSAQQRFMLQRVRDGRASGAGWPYAIIASVAKESRPSAQPEDCFAALAMTLLMQRLNSIAVILR